MRWRNNLLVLVILFALLITLRAAFGFNGLYGQDSFEYKRYAEELNAYWKDGAKPADFFWPYGYPLASSLVQFIFSDSSLALQLVSLLSFFGILLYLQLTIKELFGKYNYSFILFLIFSAPFFFRASFLCMSDMMAAFFGIGSAYHYIKYSRQKFWHDYLFCCCFAAVAVFTRYSMAVLLLLPVLSGSITFLRNFKVAPFLLTLVCLLLITLPHLFLRTGSFLSFTGHTFLEGWSVQNFFKNRFLTPDEGIAAYKIWNILFYFGNLFHPVYLFFALPFFPFSFSGLNKHTKIILASVIIYLAFLSGIPSQNKRYILPCIPFVIPVIFQGYLVLHEKISFRKYIYGVSLIAAIALNIYAFSIVHKRMRLEKTIYNYLASQTQAKTIYTFDVEVALRGYHLQKQVLSLWTKEYDDFENNALVLFNEKNFSRQWADHLLFRNWKKMNAVKNLKPVHDFGEGWILYEIQ